MTLRYTGQVSDGNLTITRAKKLRLEVEKTFDGQNVEITIKRAVRKRSTAQNAYYWSVVLPMLIDGFIDAGNDDLQVSNPEHIEWVHHSMKDLHLGNGLQVSDVNGESIALPPSTKTLTTIEFMGYIQNIQKWAAECLNIYIPDPNEQGELTLKT